MKIFEPKLYAHRILFNLLNDKLIAVAKKVAYTPKSIICLNLPPLAITKLKAIFPQTKIQDIDFSDIKRAYFPSSSHRNLVLANLSFIKQIDLNQLLRETNRLMGEDDLFIFATFDHHSKSQLPSFGKLLDNLEIITALDDFDTLHFISYKEALSPILSCHLFVASHEEIAQFNYFLEPEFIEVPETHEIEDKEIENAFADTNTEELEDIDAEEEATADADVEVEDTAEQISHENESNHEGDTADENVTPMVDEEVQEAEPISELTEIEDSPDEEVEVEPQEKPDQVIDEFDDEIELIEVEEPDEDPEGEGELESEGDPEGEGDLDTDIETEVDADADADSDSEADVEEDEEHEGERDLENDDDEELDDEGDLDTDEDEEEEETQTLEEDEEAESDGELEEEEDSESEFEGDKEEEKEVVEDAKKEDEPPANDADVDDQDETPRRRYG